MLQAQTTETRCSRLPAPQVYMCLLFNVNSWRVCYYKTKYIRKNCPINDFSSHRSHSSLEILAYEGCHVRLYSILFSENTALPIQLLLLGICFPSKYFNFKMVFFSSVLAYRLKHEHFWKEITWWLALRAIIITVLLLNVCVFADVDFPETCFKHFIVSNLKTKSTLLQK